MHSKDVFIGKWLFNYWPEKRKSSIITIIEDGTAVTSNGTWYQWESKSHKQISIFNEGYVLYNGILNGDTISGLATSEYSGNQWSWNATKRVEPIITSINQNDLLIGWWTLINEIDEVDNNIVQFKVNGKFSSQNYPIGKWSVDGLDLHLVTADGFLRYKAKCIDGVICGKCRNKIGIEWPFKLEHTCIPIEFEQLPTSIQNKEETVNSIAESDNRKKDSKEIIAYLEENGIHYFYHFTARKNIPSIIEHEGLYSWKYMVDHNITIPDPGGDEWSREFDVREGLEDYVRLSFCIDHPMKYRKRSSDPVLLKIDIEAATFADTLFSDMNAASSAHKHGKGLADLKRVDMNAVKKQYVAKDDPDFRKHQAEVMIKTYLSSKYITNLFDFK